MNWKFPSATNSRSYNSHKRKSRKWITFPNTSEQHSLQYHATRVTRINRPKRRSLYGHNAHLLILHQSAAESFIKLRCLAKPHKGAKIPFQFRILSNCSLQHRLKNTNPSPLCSVQKGHHRPSSEVLFDRCHVDGGGGRGRWLFTDFAFIVRSSHMHLHRIIFATW